MVEERIKQLLNDQPSSGAGGQPVLTPFEHLARVHALTVYQTIGLYDGDIRLRHVAETQIPTLNSWLRQLVQSSSSTAKQGMDEFISSLLFPPNREEHDPPSPQTTMKNIINAGETASLNEGSFLGPEDTAWYAWLFAETIRRTWYVSCCVQTIYLTVQVRWAPCPGGLPLTVRKGMWTAGSAYTWASMCDGCGKLGNSADFIRREQGFRIFQKDPDDVDEFSRRMVEMTFGMDKVEQWKASAGLGK